MTVYYGIDVGSSSIKGAVLDLERESIEHVVQRPFPDPVAGLAPLYFEVATEQIVAGVQKVLDRLVASDARGRAVVFCSQMGGVVLANEHGEALSNYLSWRDQRVLEPLARGGTWFDEFTERVAPADRVAIGRELRPGSAVSLLAWLSEHGYLPGGAITAMNPGDYVLGRLCGAPPRMEPTLALGLLDLRTQAVHHDWLERLGLGDIAWPAIAATRDVVGRVTVRGNQLDCHPAVGDHQAALLGTGLVEGELSVNVSTGAQVSLLTPTLQPGDYQTRPYFGGRYLNTITHQPGGRALNVLVGLLGELATGEGVELRDAWGTIARSVEQTSDERPLEVDLSFFAGAAEGGGSIGGIRGENLTVGQLFRGAFRNMAATYAACARRLSPSADFRGAVISGGLPQRMAILRQMIADEFAVPARTVTTCEETLAGLLRLAQEIEGRPRATPPAGGA